MLYLRGEREGGSIDTYTRGLRDAGIANLTHGLIPAAGHFAQEEAPAETWRSIDEFVAAHGAG